VDQCTNDPVLLQFLTPEFSSSCLLDSPPHPAYWCYVRLLLIDGHYYVYRSYHAIQSLTNSRGEPTNAIFGFVKTVRKMSKDLRPDLAAIFWDEGLPAKRIELQPAYKQQREAMPEKMIPQLDFIREFCAPMGFASIAKSNTEADDLMACYAVAASARQLETILATNDKDLFQLVSDSIKVYSTNKTDLKNPKDPHALLGVEEVMKKWGVTPASIGEVLALTGDSVDNIPGIDGIGQKTAANLIREFGTIEQLFENLERLPNVKLKEKLAANRERIEQNREMVRLELDHELPVPVTELKIKPDYAAYIAGLKKCEFRTLLAEVEDEAKRVRSPRGELSPQGELF
jgi:5'-3' exonuclease